MVSHDVKDKSFHPFLDFLLLTFLILFLLAVPWFYGLARFRDQLIAQSVIFAVSLLAIPFLDFKRIFSTATKGMNFWMILSLGFGLVYVLCSIVPYQSLLTFFRLLSLVIFYWMIRRVINTDKKFQVILWIIFAAGVFYSAYGLFQYYGFLPKSFWYQPGCLAARYINGGHFAGFLIFPFWMGVSLVGASHKSIVKFFVLCLMFILLWALLLTRARAEWIAFFIGAICFMGFAGRAKLWKPKILLGLVFCGVLGGLILFKMGVLREVFIRIQEIWLSKFYSLDYRLNLWKSCLSAIAGRPWGWGLGTFAVIYPQFRMHSDRFFVDHSHNEILQMGVDLGIPGILLILGIFIAYLKTALIFLKSEGKNSSKKITAAAFIAVWISLAISSQMDFPLRIYATSFFLFAFLALSAYLFESVSVPAGLSFFPKAFGAGPYQGMFRIVSFLLVLLLGGIAMKQLSAQMTFEKGQHLEKTFRWNQAEAAYQQAIHTSPLYVKYYEGLADLYKKREILSFGQSKKKQYRKARVEIYEQMNQIHPYEAGNHYKLALMHEDVGQIEKAKLEFQKAVTLEPVNETFLSEYGYFAVRHEMVGEAVEAFEKFKNIHSHLEGYKATPCEILKTCYAVTQDYEQLKRVIPHDWQAHHCFGVILAEHGRWDLAKVEFDLAIQSGKSALDSDGFRIHVRRPIANFYVASKRLEDALRLYQNALIQTPEDEEAQSQVRLLSEQLKYPKVAGLS